MNSAILRSPLVLLFGCAVAAIVLALMLEVFGGTTVDLNAVLGVAIFVLLALGCGVVALVRQEA